MPWWIKYRWRWFFRLTPNRYNDLWKDWDAWVGLNLIVISERDAREHWAEIEEQLWAVHNGLATATSSF